jgi:hypothetical protein
MYSTQMDIVLRLFTRVGNIRSLNEWLLRVDICLQ